LRPHSPPADRRNGHHRSSHPPTNGPTARLCRARSEGPPARGLPGGQLPRDRDGCRHGHSAPSEPGPARHPDRSGNGYSPQPGPECLPTVQVHDLPTTTGQCLELAVGGTTDRLNAIRWWGRHRTPPSPRCSRPGAAPQHRWEPRSSRSGWKQPSSSKQPSSLERPCSKRPHGQKPRGGLPGRATRPGRGSFPWTRAAVRRGRQPGAWESRVQVRHRPLRRPAVGSATHGPVSHSTEVATTPVDHPDHRGAGIMDNSSPVLPAAPRRSAGLQVAPRWNAGLLPLHPRGGLSHPAGWRLRRRCSQRRRLHLSQTCDRRPDVAHHRGLWEQGQVPPGARLLPSGRGRRAHGRGPTSRRLRG